MYGVFMFPCEPKARVDSRKRSEPGILLKTKKDSGQAGMTSKKGFCFEVENGGNRMTKLDEIKKIINVHKQKLRDEYKITEIGIFGSYVRGEQKKRSDIDILVEFSEPISLLDLVGAENYLKKILKMKVDLVPKDDVRPELKEIILKETVLI
jgi:predicted nucleotidyltransferase